MPDFFRETKLFAFDLDGTLLLGEDAVPGAVELVSRLRKSRRVAFFTNNSSKTDREVHEKLRRLGFEARPEEVHTSCSAAARQLREQGLDDVYVVGSDGLRRAVVKAGLRVVEEGVAKNLLVGIDHDFGYRKIAAALSVLLRGGRFVACNEDARYPAGDGAYLPGCGAMVGAIAAAAGRRPDFVAGKPNTFMLAVIAGDCGAGPREIVVVGDSAESDVAMAMRHGSKAVLIDPVRNDDAGDLLVVRDLRGLRDAIGEG